MLLSFAYLAFLAILRLFVGCRRNAFTKDVELLVLRHQLAFFVGSNHALRFGQPIVPS